MSSYFYKLREKATGRLYVGCQYSKFADPANLLTTYKTSCRYVRERGVDAFEIIKIIIRGDAREFERRYLRLIYYSLGREAFERTFINRNLAPGVIFSDEVRERMSRGVKLAVEARRAAGTLRPTFLGRSHSAATKLKLSIKASERLRVNGHPRGMKGKTHTEDTKKQIQQSSIDNSAMRGRTGVSHPTGGTVWWNDGISHKRSTVCPGDGWVEGRIFKRRKMKTTSTKKETNGKKKT